MWPHRWSSSPPLASQSSCTSGMCAPCAMQQLMMAPGLGLSVPRQALQKDQTAVGQDGHLASHVLMQESQNKWEHVSFMGLAIASCACKAAPLTPARLSSLQSPHPAQPRPGAWPDYHEEATQTDGDRRPGATCMVRRSSCRGCQNQGKAAAPT